MKKPKPKLKLKLKLKLRVPSEAFETRALARWLGRQTALLTSKIPIGDSTLSDEEGKKLQSMGVRRGVPDFLLVHKYTHRILFVELKRARGGKLSREQKIWRAAIGKRRAKVARGFKEAKHIITNYYAKDGLQDE